MTPTLADISPLSWLYYVDPSVQKIGVGTGSPIPLFVFILAYLYFIFHLGPKLMRQRPAFDLRPYMLIINAMLFGASGAGIPLALWLSSWARIPWKCSEDPLDPMIQETQIYLGIAFFWVQVVTALTPIFMTLRKKSNQNYQVDAIRCCHTMLLTYFGTRMYPRGPFAFRATTEVILTVFRRAYYILTVPGSSSPNSGKSSRIKLAIQYLALFLALVNTYHMVYFVYYGCDGIPIIKVFTLVSAAIESVYLILLLTGFIGRSNRKINKID